MLDLAEIFELIEDSFNHGSSFEQRLVERRVLDRFHVLADFGDQLQLTGTQ